MKRNNSGHYIISAVPFQSVLPELKSLGLFFRSGNDEIPPLHRTHRKICYATRLPAARPDYGRCCRPPPERGRKTTPTAPRCGRRDFVSPQLPKPQPTSGFVCRNQGIAHAGIGDCRGSRGRARAAFYRRLHPSTGHEHAGRHLGKTRPSGGRSGGGTGGLGVGGRIARLRRGFVVYAGVGFGLGAVRRNRQPQLPLPS